MTALLSAPASSTFAPAVLEKKDKLTPPPEWYATASQRAGLARLHALAGVFTAIGDDAVAGFHPLVRSLIIGPSGSGKSTLARQFAQERGWKFLAVDCGSWLPQGALTKPATLRVIRDLIRSADRTVLFLDELCKLLPRTTDAASSWALGCWSEFLALDGDTRLLNHEWSQEDIRRLKTTCFVIGGGAFTHAVLEAKLSQKRGQLGFQDKDGPACGYAQKIRESLPEEVFSRFHPQHILLESPSRDEFARAIERIHDQLGVPRNRPIKELLDEAQASAGGLRWVDAYLTELLLAHPDRLPAQREEPEPKKRDGYDFFLGDTIYYCREVTKASFQLRSVLARLKSQLNAQHGAIVKNGDKRLEKFVFGPDGLRLSRFLLAALQQSNACVEVKADDSLVLEPIIRWQEEAWVGLMDYPVELSRFGLFGLIRRSWDLATRIAELRGRISERVAAGRYS
jgi:hypothetical protein